MEVERVKNAELTQNLPNNSSEHNVVKNTITEAIRRQKARYGQNGIYNSSLSSYEVATKLKLDPDADRLLKDASERLVLSARSYFKTIKVAQTIADLEGSDVILKKHIAEALIFRKRG